MTTQPAGQLCGCPIFTTHTTHGNPWCQCGHQYAAHTSPGAACTMTVGGEQHTATLSLADEGNAPAPPISDEMVLAAANAVHAFRGTGHAAIRDALEAAYPAIRQRVAEEIAAALDAVPAEVYPEDIFPPDGTSTDCQSARVMRFAYPAAAKIAREIGAKA